MLFEMKHVWGTELVTINHKMAGLETQIWTEYFPDTNMIASDFKTCPLLQSSSNPVTPCGAHGIHEELPGIAVCSYPLDLIPMIFLCFLSHPLLSFATFSSACLSFCIPEDSNLMQFPLLLLFLYVMCVKSNAVSSIAPVSLCNVCQI